MTRIAAMGLGARASMSLGVLLLAMLASTWVGSAGLLSAVTNAWVDIAILRGLRVISAALVGAGLGLAGVLMQTLLANDLADPYVLGLSGAASLGAVLSLVLFPAFPPGFLAAAAALVTAAFVIRAGRARASSDTLLSGVVIGAALAAGTGVVLTLAPQANFARSANHWLFGGLGSPSRLELSMLAAGLALASVWTLRAAPVLDRLSLGHDVAIVLGVDVPRYQRHLTWVAVLLTSLAVALGGLIGFVGLAAPHLGRALVGGRHSRLIPVTLWIGALSLVLADAAARTLFSPRELPVGLVTASVLGPALLFMRRKRR